MFQILKEKLLLTDLGGSQELEGGFHVQYHPSDLESFKSLLKFIPIMAD